MFSPSWIPCLKVQKPFLLYSYSTHSLIDWLSISYFLSISRSSFISLIFFSNLSLIFLSLILIYTGNYFSQVFAALKYDVKVSVFIFQLPIILVRWQIWDFLWRSKAYLNVWVINFYIFSYRLPLSFFSCWFRILWKTRAPYLRWGTM